MFFTRMGRKICFKHIIYARKVMFKNFKGNFPCNKKKINPNNNN